MGKRTYQIIYEISLPNITNLMHRFILSGSTSIDKEKRTFLKNDDVFLHLLTIDIALS
tara:strand:+ start:1123 stop:1296 length:174 start_codon:yes stop_codon:yes gene_type:complete